MMKLEQVQYQHCLDVLSRWVVIGPQATVSLESLGATNEVYKVVDQSIYYLKKYQTRDAYLVFVFI
jgi:hypothetical protein